MKQEGFTAGTKTKMMNEGVRDVVNESNSEDEKREMRLHGACPFEGRRAGADGPKRDSGHTAISGTRRQESGLP